MADTKANFDVSWTGYCHNIKSVLQLQQSRVDYVVISANTKSSGILRLNLLVKQVIALKVYRNESSLHGPNLQTTES